MFPASAGDRTESSGLALHTAAVESQAGLSRFASMGVGWGGGSLGPHRGGVCGAAALEQWPLQLHFLPVSVLPSSSPMSKQSHVGH